MTEAGKPDPNFRARGMCSDPYDCFSCNVMQAELARHPPGQVIWVCPDCIKVAVTKSKDGGLPYLLPGHYSEGQCQLRTCSRPARTEEGVELPPGYSRFLQLFIGPVNL
jgi:hypothetical protein